MVKDAAPESRRHWALQPKPSNPSLAFVAYLPARAVRGHPRRIWQILNSEPRKGPLKPGAGREDQQHGRDQSHVQSSGFKLAGTVRVPDGVKPGERRPAFIVMHGFGSNSSSSNVLEPCKMFEKLGYVTLRIDMPGCGESEGPRGNLICLEQVQAASDALTMLAKNPNVEPLTGSA